MRRFAACVLMTGGLVAAGPAVAQLPLEPVRETGQSVTGAFEGWYPNPDGTSTILVGYFNRNSRQTFDIPPGPNNRLEPGNPDQGQPTHFLPRRQWGVFTITVPKDFGEKRLTWTLVANGQTTVIPMHLDPLWVVSPLKEAGVGNTPPSLRFEGGGPAQQGPPRGLSATYTAVVGQPLTLTAWVSDDGIRAPEVRPRPGPPANLTWSKFRGPGDVSFENAAPMVGEADGKATTTATFSAPGEYILRAQSNDSTGDGGGGFQCCWTNAHLKVTVQDAPPAPSSASLDFDVFRAAVQPIFLRKREKLARCYVCHSQGTPLRLQALSPGATTWTDEQSRKNFDAIRRVVVPGNPGRSRLLTMPLAEEAGGTSFHPGGKHWTSKDDPEWKVMASWIQAVR